MILTCFNGGIALKISNNQKRVLISCLIIISFASNFILNKSVLAEPEQLIVPTDNCIMKQVSYFSLLNQFHQDKLGKGLDPLLPTGMKEEQAETYGLILSAESIQYSYNPNDQSKKRIIDAVSWLINNSDADKDGIPGWGLPGAWDAFGDGTINPENSQYTISNALVIQGLLDALKVPGLLDAHQINEIQYLLKNISLYYCKNVWTDTKDGGFFWYSPNKNDAHFAPNVSSMFMGMLCRIILEQNNLFTESEKKYISQKIDQAANAIISRVIWREGLPYWNYIARPNMFNQDEPNDLVHHGYILWGMEIYREFEDSSVSKIPWTVEQANNSLNSFWRDDKLYDCPQNTTYTGVQLKYNDRPVILWGAAMMVAFTAKYGSIKDSDRCYDYIFKNYGSWPDIRMWPLFFGADDSFYPRYTSHVLWGLALNNTRERSMLKSVDHEKVIALYDSKNNNSQIAFYEIEKLGYFYNKMVLDRNEKGARAAHMWANQIRCMMGISSYYDNITGKPLYNNGKQK